MLFGMPSIICRQFTGRGRKFGGRSYGLIWNPSLVYQMVLRNRNGRMHKRREIRKLVGSGGRRIRNFVMMWKIDESGGVKERSGCGDIMKYTERKEREEERKRQCKSRFHTNRNEFVTFRKKNSLKEKSHFVAQKQTFN
mmetsp:Transcript_42078/g.63519  ORF Transcript_42078/g.63519 Transcript_42078/m.63519 type:complete len:139 (+) Transcript_42078:858-1274(+)